MDICDEAEDVCVMSETTVMLFHEILLVCRVFSMEALENKIGGELRGKAK